jgi:hypothetical protein
VVLSTGVAYGVLVSRSPWRPQQIEALRASLRPPHFRGVRIYYYSENGVPLERPTEIQYEPFGE